MKRYALLAVIALVGAACSSGSGDASLTVYSGRSEGLVQPLIDRFMEETGIEVTVRYDDSATLAATILEEGSGSPADVFFSQDPASLGSVALDSLFITLPDEVRALVPERLSDAGGAWIGVSGRSRVVIYDTELLDPSELPATEDGFTDPAWAGRVAIAPTNGSFLAFVAAKILLDGEDATRAWLEGMAANGSPTFPNNSSIVMAANDGQIEAGLVNHYYQLRTLAEDPNAPGANHFFGVATAGSIVMPAGVGVLASSDEQDAALRFVEFLLSEDSQVYFADETLEYPVIDGVPAADVLPPLDSLVTPALDLSQLATTLDKATDLVAEAGLL